MLYLYNFMEFVELCWYETLCDLQMISENGVEILFFQIILNGIYSLF